ncbi:hypothetical protein J2S36_000029 [Arcanobacterium hippocoleae]|uniref:Uncharacterized protein n=1 Tax=Arcanobacterium hippocoleae TaxID=149017 RepID=A0ABU1SZJ9_9ACTO|nr:hypothetical protein [Arcanobacterium hippocoleae]
MKEYAVKQPHSLPQTCVAILKCCAFIGSSQLFAFILFHFVSRVNEAGDFLVSLLELSSLTILIGLLLKSGIAVCPSDSFPACSHHSFHNSRVVYAQV